MKGEVLSLEVAWRYYGASGVETTRNNDVLGVFSEYNIDSNALRAGIVVQVDASVHFFLWETHWAPRRKEVTERRSKEKSGA